MYDILEDSNGTPYTDPYSHMTWGCGLGHEDDPKHLEHGDSWFYADYHVFDDGRMIVHITWNSESAGTCECSDYEVYTPTSKEDALELARGVFDYACDSIDMSGCAELEDHENITGLKSTDKHWFEITEEFGKAAADAWEEINK
jgi:hypothetical protein